jgi:ketosteroid isomerase-like protein
MAAMTEDCVFDNIPPPDGERYEGQTAVRSFWERFFAESPHAVFEEESIAASDRCIVRWLYRLARRGRRGRPCTRRR